MSIENSRTNSGEQKTSSYAWFALTLMTLVYTLNFLAFVYGSAAAVYHRKMPFKTEKTTKLMIVFSGKI